MLFTESKAQFVEPADISSCENADPEADRQGTHSIRDSVQILDLITQGGLLTVSRGDARLVTEPLADLQGAAEQRLGRVMVAPQLGQDAELVVAVRAELEHRNAPVTAVGFPVGQAAAGHPVQQTADVGPVAMQRLGDIT